MTRRALLNNVKQAVFSIDKNATVILFGSRARGDAKKDSDWDFLILTQHQADNKRKELFRNKLVETEILAEQTINTVIFSRNQWKKYKITPLYYFINKDGIIL